MSILTWMPLAVEADLPRAENLVPHEGVARESVEAVRMIGLVQRQLEVDGLVVQGDVGVLRSGQLRHADLPHAEVGVDGVLAALAGQHGLDLVQIRVLQRPEPHLRQGDFEFDLALSLGDLPATASGDRPGLELKLELHRLRRGLVQRRFDRDLPGVDVRHEMHGLQGRPWAVPRDRRSARCPWPGRSPVCLRA